MVDIETYRARIGSFGVSGMSTSKLKLKIKLRCKVQIQMSMECSVQTLIFLCMVTSTMLCVSLHYQEQGNTYTGTTPSHTDSLYSDTQLCIKCLFEHVHELYTYILMIYVVKLTEMSLFYTPSHRSSRAFNIWTPGTNAQVTLMENVFNGTVHGTCSYLIGNVGSHAYHGNPFKERSRTKIPELDIEERIKELHYKMVNELSGQLDPSIEKWEKLIGLLNIYFNPVEIKTIKSMMDVCEKLRTKGKIHYGQYQTLRDMFSSIEHQPCCDIVDRYSQQIEECCQPDRETQTPQLARETQTPRLTRETQRPQPTRETQTPQPVREIQRQELPTQRAGVMARSADHDMDDLAQHTAGLSAGETVYSRDTAAYSHKMPSGEETRRLHEAVNALARHAYATGFGAAETVYSRDTAASSHNKMPSVDMEASVKVWGDNDKLCYETKGIKDVVQKIYSEEHSYMCVVGEPGCGKSTAIRHAALYLKDKLEFIIYPVSGPKQFIDYLDPDKPQVFIFDDFCGEYFIDQDKLKAWGEYSEKIKDCLQVHKNTKVLFSLRVQLHSELKSKGNTHIYNDQRHIINFSDKEYKLSRDTMQDMLRHYLQVQQVQNIEGLIRCVWWERAEQFAGCFPLLCKVFSEDKSVRVDPEKYFRDPLPALQNIFKRIKSDNKHQFCGLLLCGVTDLKDEYFSTSYKQNKPQQFDSLIESQNLDPRKDLSDIKSALQALDGVYISHIGNRYTFLHSIFQNIVTFLYDDKYYVFKYATLDFIHTRVRLFSKFDTDDDYVKVFYGDDCVELLVDRMIEELRSDDRYRWDGVSFIVYSHYIDNKELFTCLMKKLFDSKHTQITQDKIDVLFVHCLFTVCNYTPSPPHTDVTSCPQYQLLLSLIDRCGCNKQIEGWGYPLLVSVDCGSLPVTKVLVEHQADVNVVDSEYKRCVLHWAVNCRNNVDMTKYLLSLPNLKCLNHRDSDSHTPYWYVVNNKPPTWSWPGVVRHRDEVMELYKHTAAICE